MTENLKRFLFFFFSSLNDEQTKVIPVQKHFRKHVQFYLGIVVTP